MRHLAVLAILFIGVMVADARGETLTVTGQPPTAAKRAAEQLAAAIDGEQPAAVVALLAADVEFPAATQSRAWVKSALAVYGTVAATFAIAPGGTWHLDADASGVTAYRGDRAAGPVTVFELRKARGRWLVHAAWIEGVPAKSATGIVTSDVFNDAELGVAYSGGVATIGHGSGTGRPPTIQTAPKAPPAQLIALVTGGGLDPAIVRRYIKRTLPTFTACYARELVSTPKLKGRLRTTFTIGADGTVGDAAASGVGAGVASCVASALNEISYPRPEQPAVAVKLVLEFRPRR